MGAEALRGLVVTTWETNGRPSWDFPRTADEVERADDALTRRGLNPAHALRARRLAGDRAAVEVWTRGCRFPWLGSQPRAMSSPKTKKALGPKGSRPHDSFLRVWILGARDPSRSRTTSLSKV